MAKNKCVIFYSWQSDIKPVRNFIQNALESISGNTLGLDVEIDHDTCGLSGSPKIEDAIIEKIKKCDVFVADVTIINSEAEGRKVCNPNVLLELGVAIGTLGWEKIILLNCQDHGSINDLPFDFNHNRIVSFSIAEDSKPKAKNLISNKVFKTIKILQDKGLIHGGNPILLDAKRKLYSVLARAFDNLLNERPIIVNADNIDTLNAIEAYIPEDNFKSLHNVFSELIKISSSDDEQYYTHRLREECFEPIYLEYSNLLPTFDATNILTEHYYNLLNSLLPFEKQVPFTHERMHDNKFVFSSDPKHLIAYSTEGVLLLDGSINKNGHFCGFQIERSGEGIYVGYFEDGLRSGQGTLYVDFKHNEERYPICSGQWENDELIEGDIYSISAYWGWITEIPENGLPFENFISNSSMLHGWLPDVEDDLCPVFDVHVEHGVGKIIDGTLQRYNEQAYMDKNLLGTYLNRVSKYNIPLNETFPIGDSIGINNDFRIEKYNDRIGF